MELYTFRNIDVDVPADHEYQGNPRSKDVAIGTHWVVVQLIIVDVDERYGMQLITKRPST